ncbi:tail protein [Pseudomonas phage PSA-KC1]
MAFQIWLCALRKLISANLRLTKSSFLAFKTAFRLQRLRSHRPKVQDGRRLVRNRRRLQRGLFLRRLRSLPDTTTAKPRLRLILPGVCTLPQVAPGSTSDFLRRNDDPDNFSSSPILSLESAPYNGGGVLLNAYASTVASETRNDTSGSLVVTGVSQASIEGLQQYTTLDQARDGSAFLLINNELFVYVGFVDNGGGQVTFPNVYRGVLDTTPGNHAANDRVWFISGTDGLLPELVSVGTMRYVAFGYDFRAASLIFRRPLRLAGRLPTGPGCRCRRST